MMNEQPAGMPPLPSTTRKAFTPHHNSLPTGKRGCRITPKAKLFLTAYAETACVTEAAKRSGMSRDAHYKRLERGWRYKAEFEDIEEGIRDSIRAEVHRRAVEGWD